MDVKPGTPPVSGRSTTPTSSPYRASSTSPSSQSSKMNSMLYQKQFQPSSAGLRMAQHFPGQFNPQILSQPSIVSPLVRPHANSFGGGVQRSPMGPPISPNVSGESLALDSYVFLAKGKGGAEVTSQPFRVAFPAAAVWERASRIELVT
ncbi:Protein prrc2c [Goodea atripinnis]|uniref:Protein prrc2c n=1 Tax=Goodea atripinnis TaxID=208336 RepID=A0ABV0PA44_9TELE